MNEEHIDAISETAKPEPEASGFDALALMPEVRRAIEAMGFAEPTEIQARAIPLLRTGVDIIGRSQTGTGKTMAFAIPAVEMIDRDEAEPTVQVLILCPTRELAQQGCEEIRKLTRYMLNIWPADIYGGAAMDRQIFRLKRANLVIGTPGRVMDHMRRGTLSLSNVKLVVLDEADEMLSMGFREDIETILRDVPETRQTVLFSATMPQAILELTDQFMKAPTLIEIRREEATLDQIRQLFMEVPMGRKLDALNLLLRGVEPVRTMIFCNTKLMVDEVSAFLNRNGFACEGIHGDMNQSQRTRVMEGFKAARIPILVATDVAARGIDVNDIDYVINYDIPQNSDLYIHRIGRTGRAGKAGTAVTILSGKRQFFFLRDIARSIHSEIGEIPVPTVAQIRLKRDERSLESVRAALAGELPMEYQTMVGKLMAEGYQPALIASAAMMLAFRRDDDGLSDIEFDRRSDDGQLYRKLIISIGRRQKAAPNHIVSAIAGRADIPGGEIGRIEIYDERTVVGVPAERAEAIERAMQGATILGQPVRVRLSDEKASARPVRGGRKPVGKPMNRAGRDRNAAPVETPTRRGKVRLSPEARARLLDTSDLSRFDVGPRERLGDTRRNPGTAAGRSKYDKPRRPRMDERRGTRRGESRSRHGKDTPKR